MIDRGDIRQAIDRCSNIWASPGAGCGQFSIRRSPGAKFKEAGRRSEIDVWAESTRFISTLVICIIICLSWAVNHYRDNAITYKTSATKMPGELKLANRGNYWHADASAWCCCARCKYTKELAGAKLKMMLCVMMLPLVVVGCTSSSLSVSAWSHHRLKAWISYPDWQTPLNGIISPSERLITMQKQLEGTQKLY